MKIETALRKREEASEALSVTLRGLEGAKRREAILKAKAAGVGPTELSKLLGVSRQRIYELLES